MELKLIPGVLEAIRILNSKGYSAYLVGGAVRDAVMELPPNDYDMATSANAQQLLEIFKDYKAKLYSNQATVGVKVRGAHIEITPLKGKDIYEDLSKRDFTINGMAYSLDTGLIDPFNGIRDIRREVVRAIACPTITLRSDPIRILKGIRIAATRGFSVDLATKEAMLRLSYLLDSVKVEKLKPELDPILLVGEPAKCIREFLEVFRVIFKPLKDCYKFDQRNRKWHNLDVFEHIMKVLDSTKNNLVLRYAALLHDIKKPEAFSLDEKGIGHFYGHERLSTSYAYEILTKLKYNGVFVSRVCRLIYYHDYMLVNDENKLLKFLYRFGTEDLDLYFGLRRADILGQNPNLYDRIYEIDEITEHIRKLLRENKIICYRNLKINGRDLLEIGFEPYQIGRALEIILKETQNKKIKNDHDKLYELARSLRYNGMGDD